MKPMRQRWSTLLNCGTTGRPLLWPITPWMCANIDVQQAYSAWVFDSTDVCEASVDCSQRPGWSTPQALTSVPTLTTSTRTFLCGDKPGLGFLSPVEALATQGLANADLTFMDVHESFTLAGNAMSVQVVAAPLMGVLWALGGLVSSP